MKATSSVEFDHFRTELLMEQEVPDKDDDDQVEKEKDRDREVTEEGQKDEEPSDE